MASSSSSKHRKIGEEDEEEDEEEDTVQEVQLILWSLLILMSFLVYKLANAD